MLPSLTTAARNLRATLMSELHYLVMRFYVLLDGAAVILGQLSYVSGVQDRLQPPGVAVEQQVVENLEPPVRLVTALTLGDEEVGDQQAAHHRPIAGPRILDHVVDRYH